METDNSIKWLEEWYQSQCNGDWEHSYGIEIETLDNPGWSVTIDLNETAVVLNNSPYELVEVSENNWYGYSINENIFTASGDPAKLLFLIDLFRKLVTKAA